MVPAEEQQAGASSGKVLRSRAARARAAAGAGDGGGGAAAPAAAPAATGEEQQRRRGRRGRRPSTASSLDKGEQIKRRVKYMLMKMRTDRNLLDVYSRDGWKGQSREKIRPEQELRRAEAQILRHKLAIREAVHELDDLGLEGSLDEHFDDEGRIYHEAIFCAKCKSEEALLENDIILCDGACNRGFHQFCLDPPLETKDIPPGDEGWLCPVCDCKMECVEAINADLGTKYEVENGWKEFFSKEAAGGGSREGDDWPSSDSEDDDYDPDDQDSKSPEAAAAVPEVGIDVDWPSTDSEDDDFNPERGGSEEEKQGGNEEESESEEESGDDGEKREEASGDGEKREEGADSDESDSDFREDEASSDDEEASDKDEKEPSVGLINLKKLARKGKRRRSSSGNRDENESSPAASDSDGSDVSLFDEFKDGGAKLGRRDSQAEASTADEDAMVIEGKRHRKALDYKKLHDEMYGNTAADDDDVASEDEDWGPKRRRRGAISDDPSRPRPPRVRRRKPKASNEDTSKGADVGTSKGVDPDASLEAAADASTRASQGPSADAASMGVHANTPKRVDADASKGVDADTSKAGASKEVDTNSAPIKLPSQSQLDGAGGSPGGDSIKRMWRRLPDAAVEGLRRVVAVTPLPSKPRKEELAAELGLSFSQVHGWFKNQRHQSIRKGLEKPKRPYVVASSSKGVVHRDGVETSSHAAAAAAAVATETTTKAEKRSNSYLADVLELKQTLDMFDNDSVLVVDAEGRTMELGTTFGNGGIGLPAHVVYAPAPIDVREQLDPHLTYP